MSQEAENLLRARSLLNRHLYQNRIADYTEVQEELSKPTFYTGFDASNGLGKLRDSSGNISYGEAITNGAIGKGEVIRLRNGAITSYDAMPTRKTEEPPNKRVNPALIIGFLTEVVKINKINNPSPLQDFILRSRKITCLNLANNTASIASSSVIDTYRSINFYHGYTPYPATFGYYSMGWDKSTVKYLTARVLSFVPEDPLMPNTFNIASVRVFVDSINANSQKLTTSTIELTTTSINLNDQIISHYYVYEIPVYQTCIKYRNSAGEITYTVFSGTSQASGGFIWNLGKIDSLAPSSNPCCFFGLFERNQIGNIVDRNIGTVGGYGAQGGIVIYLSRRDSSGNFVEVFIPEKYLSGDSGQITRLEDLIFSGHPSPDPRRDGLGAILQNITIGKMPKPLDRRADIYTGTIPNLPAEAGGVEGYKKLVFYTTTNQDRGKQIFS
ncbi:MAG: hypothetical protein ACFKPT_02585 [Gloeotrichia echinulata GP01]